MVALHPLLIKSYWVLAGIGGIWALFVISLTNPWFQRQMLYSHNINPAFWTNVSEPESFGFAKGQVQPFYLNTTDGETLHCWHVLPLDVFLEHENEIVSKAAAGVTDLKTTVGYKLLKSDHDSQVVINFHGNAGHLAQGYRTHTYRAITSIPHTHLLTCDYRGFGLSSAHNPPHLPTETGLITDGISLVNHILTTLSHPSQRTILLGQSLGTAVTSAVSLYFSTPPTSPISQNTTLLPSTLPPNLNPTQFSRIILVAPFHSIPTLISTYRLLGIIPILSPLVPYPKLHSYFTSRILDPWPTLPRLQALLTVSKTSQVAVRIHILHARNDPDIPFRVGETLYSTLEQTMTSQAKDTAHITTVHERRSKGRGIVLEPDQLGAVRRGGFAYRSAEVAETSSAQKIELEIVRFGGHDQVVGYNQVSLAVRRAIAGERGTRPGLDVE